MLIAIDYDETYTQDPPFWNSFINDAIDNGHKVICVTARHERHMDEVRNTIGYLIGHDSCYPTDSSQKREFMWQKHNEYPDVWIDDSPEYI